MLARDKKEQKEEWGVLYNSESSTEIKTDQGALIEIDSRNSFVMTRGNKMQFLL